MNAIQRIVKLLLVAALGGAIIWAIGQASLPSVPPQLGDALQTRNAPTTAPVPVPLASILSTIPGIGTITRLDQSATAIYLEVAPTAADLRPLAEALRASIAISDPTAQLVVTFFQGTSCTTYEARPANDWIITQLPCA